MNNTKENDWFSSVIANPTFTITNFRNVGLDANNTSLEDENTYKNMEAVQQSPMFQTDGKFDEVKFHEKYTAVADAYNRLADETYQEDIIKTASFHRDDIFVDAEQRRTGPDFQLVREPNPLKQRKGIRRLGLTEAADKTISEVAQTQKVWDPKSKTWHDAPNESFLTDFFDTRVLAQWDSDGEHIDPITGNTIIHKKGDLKLNDNGTYFYENLAGRSIYGRKVLSKLDTLTTDGSAWNKYDFFDSDDVDKSITGTIAKNVAMIAPMLIPGIAPWYIGAGIAKELTKVMGTLGKIFTSSDNQFLSAAEGFASSFDTSTSQYAQDHAWALENIINLTGDVAKQLYEQRWLFKYGPALFKGKMGTDEAMQKAKINEWAKEYTDTKILELGQVKKLNYEKFAKGVKDLEVVGMLNAQTKMDKYMKDFTKLGEVMSKAYMTGITVQSAYGEAKSEGASDIEAALLTLGYAAGEYAIINSKLGEWILPELRMEKEQWKQVARTLSNMTDKPLKQGADKEAKATFMKKLFNMGKDIVNANYALKTGLKATAANAIGEGVEEVSEEFLYDFAKSVSNLGSWLAGSTTRLTAWDDMTSRYGLSFVGGTIGGGVFQAFPDVKSARQLKNMSHNEAYQQLVYMARNGNLEDFIKTSNKMTLGNKNLSSTKFTIDENGDTIFAQGTENDNQDLAAKQMLASEAKMVEDILAANGAAITDDKFLETQTLNDLRYGALRNSAVASRYLQDYNTLCTDIVAKMAEVNAVNDTSTKMENGVTDKEVREGAPDAQALEDKASKAKNELKALLEIKDSYLNGERAPQFIKEAIFEMSPAMNNAFFASTFIAYAEAKTNRKIADIPQAELDALKEEYKGYSETSRKDTVYTAWTIFNNINEKASGLFADHSLKYYESINAEFNTTVNTLQTQLDNTITSMTAKSGEELVEAAGWHAQYAASDLGNKLILGIGSESDINKFNEILSKPINEEEYYTEFDKQFEIQSYIDEFIFNKVSDIVDPFVKRGFINPTTKDSVSKLLSSAEYYFQGLTEYGSDESIGRAEAALEILENRHEELNQLLHSPIAEVLNSFSLSVSDSKVNIVKLIKDMQHQLETKFEDVGSFGLGNDITEQVKEALYVIEAAKSILLAARTDGADLDNIFGYNSTVNQLSTDVEVAEVQSPIADAMMEDIETLQHRLEFFKKLNDANNEQKLNEQNKTATNKDYILYKKIGKFIQAIPDEWEGKGDLSAIYSSLIDYKSLVDSGKLSLSRDEKAKIEKDRIMLEDAIFDFFSKNQKMRNPAELSEIINRNNFNIYSENNGILDANSLDIDDNSFIYYLASRAALKASDFYKEYTSVISDTIAPVPTQELAVYLAYANVVNGDVLTAFASAINYSFLQDKDNLSIEEKNAIANKLLTENQIGMSWDGVLDNSCSPRFGNVVLLEGIPGSGKTTGVYGTVVTMLKKYHNDILNNVWVGHATKDSADKLKTSLRLDSSDSMDKATLMKRISSQWVETFNEDGSIIITDDMISIDENNTTHSAFELNEMSSVPSVILIDEVSRYSVLDMDLLERFSKRYGVTILTAGDFDQSKAVGQFKVTLNGQQYVNNLTLGRGNFIRTPKLGVSMRTNNAQKSFNLKVMKSQLNDLIANKTQEFKLHSYVDETGLYGDKIFRAIRKGEFDKEGFEGYMNTMISTLKEGEKIGYIYYSTDTPVYKTLFESTYKDKIDWHEGDSAQGLEGQYYVIEVNPKENSSAKYYSDLYTGITRAGQGSLIISGSNDYRLEYIQSVDDTSTNMESLSVESVKKFSKTREEILLDVTKDKGETTKIIPRAKDSAIITVESPDTPVESPLVSEVIETEDEAGIPETVIIVDNGLPATEEKQAAVVEASVNVKPLPEPAVTKTQQGEVLESLLYSFNTFETGWTKDGEDYIENTETTRIDGFNGLAKIESLGTKNPQDYKSILAQIRSSVFNTKDKGELIEQIESILNLKQGSNIYGTFAFKSSAGVARDARYEKFSKDKSNEELDFIYSNDSRSHEIGHKALTLIIGHTNEEGQQKDILEIPLLTLPSPFTLMTAKGFERVKDIDKTIDPSIKGHKRYVTLLNMLEGTSDDFVGKQSFINLLKVWNFTQNGVFFIEDSEWTIANNLKSQGPAIINRAKGDLYEREGFSFDGTFVDLSEYTKNPNISMSKVLIAPIGKYSYANGTKATNFAKPGHPFVLVSYDKSIMGDALKMQYYKQLSNPAEEAKVKLVYVVPPKASIGDYFLNIRNLITKESNAPIKNIGNDFTAYRLIDLLLSQPGIDNSDLIPAAERKTLEGIRAIMGELKSETDIMKQFKILKEVSTIPGLGSDMTKQQMLQNFLMRMVYPIKVGGGTVFMENNLRSIETILRANKIDGIFYNVRFDKDSKDATMSDAKAESNYTIDGIPFQINGKIDSPAFVGNITPMLSNIVSKIKTNKGVTFSTDNVAYLSGNSSTQVAPMPSISEMSLKDPNLVISPAILPSLDSWIKQNPSATVSEISNELKRMGHIVATAGGKTFVIEKSMQIQGQMTSISEGVQISGNLWKFELTLSDDKYSMELDTFTRKGTLTKVNNLEVAEVVPVETILKAETEEDMEAFKSAFSWVRLGNKQYNDMQTVQNLDEFNAELAKWSVSKVVLTKFEKVSNDLDGSNPDSAKIKQTVESIVDFVKSKLNLKDKVETKDTSCPIIINIKF